MKINLNFLFILTVFFSVIFSSCLTLKDKDPDDEFVVDPNSPNVGIGEFEAQFDKSVGLGGVKKETISAFYFPREDAVQLKFRVDFVTYNQYWSRKARESFLRALKQYNEDYDSRNLVNSGKKMLRVYGVEKGYLSWRMSAYSIDAQAGMNLGLGYSFKDRSPYFSVNQGEANYIDSIMRSNNKTSPTMTIYFTRAQAAEVAALFDQSLLRAAAEPILNAPTQQETRTPNRDYY